ncbi:MAG: DUF6531 domain-containing protein, partial [bacterium]
MTELTHAVYLPRVRPSDWFEIASPSGGDTALIHPDLPEIEAIHIPKGTVFRDRAGKILDRIALVPVPLDRSPYPTPAAFPVYFMLHPGGVRVEGVSTRGIRTVYPNVTQQPRGSEQVLWFYDPRGPGWAVYGKGRVRRDGRLIEPEPGLGLHEHMGAGHSLPAGDPPPPAAPPPDHPSCDGDPVDCSTGLFLHARTDVAIADDLPVEIARTYRPGDTVTRAFGKGTNHAYGMYLRNPQPGSYNQMELILSDGARLAFPRTGGTSLHGDYVWEHTATPSRFYGAKITAPIDATGEHWDLRLKDQTVYVFGPYTG